MGRRIVGQVVASTCVDSHGEKYDMKLLEAVRGMARNRVALHQHHDVALPVCGYMENFRIEPHDQEPGEHVLLCDVEFDDDFEVPAEGGFSWSVTQRIRGHRDAEIEIYLPFPAYNDGALIDALLESGGSLVVGRFIRKGIEPPQVALIVTVTAFLLTPVWKRIYDDNVHPRLLELWEAMSLLTESGIRPEVRHACILEGCKETTMLHLIPDSSALRAGILGPASAEAIELSRVFLLRDYEASGLAPKTLVLVFSPDVAQYLPSSLVYHDGSSRLFSREEHEAWKDAARNL